MSALNRSTPEDQGVPSQAIQIFLTAIESQDLELHSFVLLRHGQIIADAWWSPFQKEDVHDLFSLSKSFTGTAIGIAIDEGLLSLEDKVVSFFPELVPENASQHLMDMQVHHLLSMTTGHTEDTWSQLISHDDWISTFLSLPPSQAPGSVFCYNGGPSFMLSAILNKVTGQGLLDYLRPRLLEPLGVGSARWNRTPQGIEESAGGLHLSTTDVAKFGQLYLQKGTWQGQQVLSSKWVELASKKYISTANPGSENSESDAEQGYGYHFWHGRHGTLLGFGWFSQICVIMPHQDAVLAITAGELDFQAVLNACWDNLLPAMQKEAIVPNPEANNALEERLRHLEFKPVQGKHSSPNAEKLYGQRFEVSEPLAADSGFPIIQALQLDSSDDGWSLSIDSKRSYLIPCGFNAWLTTTSDFTSAEPYKLAVSAAWTNDTQFNIELRNLEAPYALRLNLSLDDDLKIGMSWNVSYGSLESPFRQTVRST